MRKIKYTDEELLKIIKDFFEKEGKPPVKNDNLGPSRVTFQRRFGSWYNALEKAGLNINRIIRSPAKTVPCKNCKKLFQKAQSQINQTKNNFCSSSCAATYNNTHKTTGTRRSKLEVWLETKLPEIYLNQEFHFNGKDTINSELDIYLPKLSLAFELNGIYHYEPIHGPKKT